MNKGYVVLINNKEPHEFETRKEALVFAKTLSVDQEYEIHHFISKSNRDGKIVYTTDGIDILDIDAYADAFNRYS